MGFIKVTVLKADQENETYIKAESVITVGQIKLNLPVPGTGGDDTEPEFEEKEMTAINLAGTQGVLVKETPAEVMGMLIDKGR